MKSPTKFYSKLNRDLKHAKKITSRVNPLGCETDLQHLKLQAYILVVHSIFEEYLEEITLAAAKRSKEDLENQGKISRSLVALVATCVADKIADTAKKKVTTDLASNLTVFVTEALNTLHKCVEDNHGIKEKDQENLLLRIGVDIKKLDLGLSQNLQNFGKTRGAIAHKFSTRREETLSDITTLVNTISRDLIALDKEICLASNPKQIY